MTGRGGQSTRRAGRVRPGHSTARRAEPELHPPGPDCGNYSDLLQVAAFQVTPYWVGLKAGPVTLGFHAAMPGLA